MTADERCPDGDHPAQYVEIGTFGRSETQRRRVCCAPPPTADQMAAKADREWLDRQRRLAEEA